MTHPAPILSQYLEIFDEACAIELARAPDTDKEKITTYIDNVQRVTKIHTFFMTQNIANVVMDIMKNPWIRDYVFCTTDRFLITLAGNEHISYMNLIRNISTIGREEGPRQHLLIDSLVPKAIADGISPPVAEVVGILRDNKFLIVPVMITLNVTTPDLVPLPEKSKKS